MVEKTKEKGETDAKGRESVVVAVEGSLKP